MSPDPTPRDAPEPPIGVMLLYMGGPSSIAEVRPFLRALFSDRELIRLPGGALLQRPFAWLISRLRAPRVEGHYAEIGGGSPLTRTTTEQAEALAARLNTAAKPDLRFVVEVGMRYSEPRTPAAAQRLYEAGARRWVVLPLYPHYSGATSGSSFGELRRLVTEGYPDVKLLEIESFFDHSAYLDVLAHTVDQGLERFPEAGRSAVTVVFSAHSLPMSMIEKGDPYRDQVEATVAGVVERLGLERWELCYQSRSGPVRWLGPNTVTRCEELIEAGQRHLLLVPVSFVSDHIETLHELDIQLRAHCLERGAEAFERAPTPGLDPGFIAALAELVRGRLNPGAS